MTDDRKAIVMFYDATFADPSIRDALMAAASLSEFQDLIAVEAERQGFVFTRADLESTFDGPGERDTFAPVELGSQWVSTIMRFGWIPKGYSR